MKNNCYLQLYCKCIFILSTEIQTAVLFTVEQKRVIAGWTELLLLSSSPRWTAGPSSLTLLRGQRVGSLGLSPCWQLLMLCEMPPRRPSLTEPSSTLSFKGSVLCLHLCSHHCLSSCACSLLKFYCKCGLNFLLAPGNLWLHWQFKDGVWYAEQSVRFGSGQCSLGAGDRTGVFYRL